VSPKIFFVYNSETNDLGIMCETESYLRFSTFPPKLGHCL